MSDSGTIVVIGGGHAAAQLCAGLAEAGLGPSVQLICEEPRLPYQRPPLSKAFLKNPQEQVQAHRAQAWFDVAGIKAQLGDAAIALDRARRRVTLRSGRSIDYAQLVLATGTRARHLPHLASGLANVAALRSASDAERLRVQLTAAGRVTILGGGFIGLEIAATARALGKRVRVLEAAPRLLLRSVSPEMAEHVLQTHVAAGIEIALGVAGGGFETQAGRLGAWHVDGRRELVDLAIMGVGSVPEHSLASDAGLPCDNGIVVDAFMRTSDPAILAIGDCTSFPEHRTGRRLRLESVQNANDQARTAVATLLGREEPYRALPWFWSEQASMRLQMAGLAPGVDGTRHRRPGATPQTFSILHYVGQTLVCAESVNAPADHMAVRKLIEAGKSPTPSVACDPSVALKSHL